ncbi:MAG: hypothetical protein AB7S55_07390 [Thiomonas sp.]
MATSKPRVVVPGGNFAGLGSAQKIREYAGDSVDISLIDRKDYLPFVPNVPTDVMENRDPARRQRLQLRPALTSDDFLTNGKIPGFGLELAQFAAEKVF